MLTTELYGTVFEQSMADSCVLRKSTDGKLDVVVVVHVDDSIVGTKGTAAMLNLKA